MNPDSGWKRFPNTYQKDLLGRPPSISKHGMEGFPFVTAKLQQVLSSYTADNSVEKMQEAWSVYGRNPPKKLTAVHHRMLIVLDVGSP